MPKRAIYQAFLLSICLFVVTPDSHADDILDMMPPILAAAYHRAGYNEGTWPVLRHNSHNDDFIPLDFGSMKNLGGFSEIAWVLGSTPTGNLGSDHPASVMSSTMVFTFKGKQYCASTAGKVAYPNLYVFDPEDGSEIWHAAPNDADLDPGPDSAAIASSVLCDNKGRLFISDSLYVYCYSMNGERNANGDMKPVWKQPMPYLYQFNTNDNRWYPVTDPSLDRVRSKPFVTMFLTRPDFRKVYIGGITTSGGIALYDPNTGELTAKANLANPAPSGSQDWGTVSYCDPKTYASSDNPLCYEPEGENPDCPGDDMSPFGIWCTGIEPQTDEPDKDYFMNPCQLEAFLSGNTVSSGAMVVNTPAVVKDPSRPQVSRFYINGTQSEFLAGYDLTPGAEDAILYRIDFDPNAPMDKRLTVCNHQLGQDDKPLFKGRMVDGDNSGSSPAVSADEKWIFGADNNGWFYCFSAEDGTRVWQQEIGSVLGSATVAQHNEADGRFYVYSMGGSKLWAFGINPATGAKEAMQTIDFQNHLLLNFWRTETGYNINFPGWTRHATASSSITGTNDLLILSFTLGWTQSVPLEALDFLDIFMVPTHTVFLFIDRLAAHTSNQPSQVIQAGVIDPNGSIEMGIVFTPYGDGLRGFLPYGSQATTLARYMEVNDMMPEGMKTLYMKPYGGVRYVQTIFE